MSTRLTIPMRKDIRDQILASRFDEESERLTSEYLTLSEAVYAEITGEYAPMMEALHPGMMRQSRMFSVEIPGVISRFTVRTTAGNGSARIVDYCSWDEFKHTFLLPDRRPIPEAWPYSIDKNGTVYKELKRLSEAAAVWYTNYTSAREQIMVALMKYKTVEQLRKGWPEMTPFYTVKEVQKTAVDVSNTSHVCINTLLGIK